MKVTLYNQQRDLPISASSVERLISFLFKALKIASDEIILHLVTEKTICHIHKQFFNDPTTTDCISFPIDDPLEKRDAPTVLGEVFVCPKTAIHYARKHEIDPYEETSLYIVHGLLHLLGYDDIRPDERTKMLAKQNRCMKMLAKECLFLSQT